ncbi:MAG TPA: glycosyltransferase [Opitutales bacterium]|jgi:glycosyltransferase involved in cell wall biosynthesis|nr:glycosyltransferase [Opitutales bacterium]
MSTSTPLRVLIVAPSQGGYGGIEAVMLAQAASLLGNSKFSPRLCFKLVQGATFGEALRTECDKLGVPYSVTQRASVDLFNNLRWAEIVHAHNAAPDIVLGAKFLRRPVVLTIHNHRPKQNSPRARLWALGIQYANVRCYISDFVRRTWEPNGPRAGSEIIPSVSRLPKREVTWDREGFFFIGRWIANKGIEELVEAYATANINRARWSLTLAGNGPLRANVEALIARHALTTVRLAGFLSEEEKFSSMGRAKWNVAPPHTDEDLGLTPIEARHLAVPSIITRDGGLPEAAGPDALVAEPGGVTSLRAQLEKAAAMPEEEYQRRAIGSQMQLDKFLRPLSDYHAIYCRLAGREIQS